MTFQPSQYSSLADQTFQANPDMMTTPLKVIALPNGEARIMIPDSAGVNFYVDSDGTISIADSDGYPGAPKRKWPPSDPDWSSVMSNLYAVSKDNAWSLDNMLGRMMTLQAGATSAAKEAVAKAEAVVSGKKYVPPVPSKQLPAVTQKKGKGGEKTSLPATTAFYQKPWFFPVVGVTASVLVLGGIVLFVRSRRRDVYDEAKMRGAALAADRQAALRRAAAEMAK